MSEIEDKHSPKTAMTMMKWSMHTELNHTKHPPTKGFLQAPLIFVFVFGCLIFVYSIQLAIPQNRSTCPPQEVVELTEEEKEAIRLERKTNLEKDFAVRCASCHQANGLGIAGQYPPLAGSRWATSDPGLIANIILKGLKGEIVVKGETYGTTAAVNMAAVPISDREIANVSTYVRQAWGNDAPEILESEVSVFREESKGQIDQWTGDQLIEMYPAAFSE